MSDHHEKHQRERVIVLILCVTCRKGVTSCIPGALPMPYYCQAFCLCFCGVLGSRFKIVSCSPLVYMFFFLGWTQASGRAKHTSIGHFDPYSLGTWRRLTVTYVLTPCPLMIGKEQPTWTSYALSVKEKQIEKKKLTSARFRA